MMGLFSKTGSKVLGGVLSTIDKAVTDKDKKNELIQMATEMHIQNTMDARQNNHGVARWVRALLAFSMFGLFGCVNYYFLQFIENLSVSDEIKVTFYYKLVSDIFMIIVTILSFYFGSSDNKPESLTDIKKHIGKIK